jgi:hypothetical protein
VLSQELRSPDNLLLETAAQIGAVRIFIDGISLLRTVPNHLNNAGNGDERGSYRRILQERRPHATRMPRATVWPSGSA